MQDHFEGPHVFTVERGKQPYFHVSDDTQTAQVFCYTMFDFSLSDRGAMKRFKRLVITAAIAVLLTSSYVRSVELPHVSAESVGFSSERLAQLSSVLQSGVDASEIPGYVALVARHGKIVFVDMRGKQDPNRDIVMSEDSIFRIYSMTKPITSVAAMILVEEGKINLSDPVEMYLPELSDLRVIGSEEQPTAGNTTTPSITVLDLLRHTSGLTYGFFKPYPSGGPLEQMYLDEGVNDLEIDNAELVTRLSNIPLKYEPGSTWFYGRSTDVLGRLIEVVSGVTLEEFFKQQIISPLDMKDTSFRVFQDKADRLAQPFYRDLEGLILPYTDPLGSVSFEAGGQGLTSTVRDYARFLQMLLNEGELGGVRILGRKTVELMTMDHLGDSIERGPLFLPGESHGFGLGFAVRTAGVRAPTMLNPMIGSVGEYYWAGYAGTFFWVDPHEDLFAIYMMQSVENLSDYAQKFKRHVLYSLVD